MATLTPKPRPPQKPALEDCCQSNCCPCIFELYEAELADYENALELWHKLNHASGNPGAQAESNPTPARSNTE
ncbi:MAG: oxidoreductase-like domain-containing protein [Burkholderiales bacterium]